MSTERCTNEHFTPGPWNVAGHYVRTPTTANERGGMDGGHIICECSIHMGRDEHQANARLIAAAPDLLAACKKALETAAPVLCTCGKPDCATTVLRAAIAKATGESQ